MIKFGHSHTTLLHCTCICPQIIYGLADKDKLVVIEVLEWISAHTIPKLE
jgi:hypothetical protein